MTKAARVRWLRRWSPLVAIAAAGPWLAASHWLIGADGAAPAAYPATPKTGAVHVREPAEPVFSDSWLAEGERAEAVLAERFAPRMKLVRQVAPCGAGDPYRPSAVDPLFDNPLIALRGPWGQQDLVKVGPSAEDLTGGLAGYSLDLPAEPLTPGCDYEAWARRTWRNSPPTIYAHVATEDGHQGKLALQYYFFYPFNDFNNLHEGDWEQIQLEFDVGTPTEALRAEPVRAIYSQHYGREEADWRGGKVEIVDDTHPVVYVSEGSHASQFSSGLVIGRNASQGFGCDNTLGRQTTLTPTVVPIPSDPSLAREEFPWIGYDGHWGELGPRKFYQGPTGPNTMGNWTRPFTWSAAARDSSLVLPAGGPYRVEAVDVFCAAVRTGSDGFRRFSTHPLSTLAGLGLVLLAVAWVVRRTSWANTDPLPLVRRRGAGQIIADSWELYRTHWWLMVKIGAPAAVPAGLSGLAQSMATGPQSAGMLAVTLGLVLFATNSMVNAAATQALCLLGDGNSPTMRQCYALATARWATTLRTFALFTVVIGALAFSIWLIPAALVLGIGWSLWNVVTQLETTSTVSAFQRSWRLVRPQWPTVVAVLAMVVLVGSFLGGLVAALLFLAVQLPGSLLNVLPGLISTVLQPFAGLLVTYAYFSGRAGEASSEPQRG
ncbi:MAG: hypothetical protein ACRCYU_24000 [Nocardioides sp.]